MESDGHSPGQILQALVENGVDSKRFIVGAVAPTPYLYNVPLEAIERFRRQITLINLALEEDPMQARKPEVIKEVVRCCYQEKPACFMKWTLCDPGAFPEPPMCFKITWRIEKPWTVHSEEDMTLRRIGEAATQRTLKMKEDAKRKQDAEEFLLLLGLKRKK